MTNHDFMTHKINMRETAVEQIIVVTASSADDTEERSFYSRELNVSTLYIECK